MSKKIKSHHELDVYKRAFEAAMEIFRLSKSFPREEMYSLTDQVRRASRSVNANLSEAWRKRRYEAHFVSKLSDAETEAAETQTWLEFAVHCEYLSATQAKALYATYNAIIATIVGIINHPESWILPTGQARRPRR
jgi:four helix bundle protein